MKDDEFSSLSTMVAGWLSGEALWAFMILDKCYANYGEGSYLVSTQNISYTLAILHAIHEPGIAQAVINVGLPFDGEALWAVVEDLGQSDFGDLFKKIDGRDLVDAIIVNHDLITYYKENEHDATTK